ncbi:pentatricopeptide repeat-containing protein At3g22670, mitochondrial [Malania oleifera]|uniref:pentatricopeptide repeat-containing protein At3g22670, mitochondrial n=1 Tax=Malania oleifera TaxID=397392 RepID=UPI0025AE5797|nr:pentatricopeptide repeat-containing protein At3g22670, mitochondrial [Malania oleifera]XP_057959675.1 pentatricopeptide repeat-containing protein At3g22670, mitochondrial [Malania oleifera]XP_057959676.1 pentatricopeptide repeat-containing protein At3g22670, mitochondrial [Malania oleifera]
MQVWIVQSSNMLSKLKTVEILRFSVLCRSNMIEGGAPLVNEVSWFFYNAFCKISDLTTTTDSPPMGESPELPVWVKFPENEQDSSAGLEDDFAIPAIASWAENQQLQDHGKVVRHMLSEADGDDVEKITRVLKSRFSSPDAVAQALNGCSVNASEGLVEQVLTRFSNDWVSAFGVFKWAKAQTGYAHSADSYNATVDILGKSRKFDLMWELVQEMQDELEEGVSLVTMSKIMRRLAKAGRWADAVDAFRRTEAFGVSGDVSAMNVLMDALVKEQSVERAHDVFLEFKNQIGPDIHTFNILIHGWCKARKLDCAWKTMEKMGKHGFHPDAVSYTSLIEAHCRDKDFRKVDAILEEMQEKGCPPNAVTCTIVMLALGKAKEINKALEVYERMKRNGCVPDAPFYSALIYILSRAGRLKDAGDLFEDMKKQGLPPDVRAYNTMISVACHHSQEETALKLLRQMEEVSCKPELKTYAPLLKMCCRKKRIKVLNFLLEHMLKNNVSIELGTYSLLVHALCKSGKVGHACMFFEEIVSKGFIPKDCTYKLLTKELERRSMVKEKGQIEMLMLQATKREEFSLQIRSDLIG